MTVKAVEAVFFARYTSSNFRAVYGRLATDTSATYTKDFLQVLQAAGSVLETVLPASRTSTTDIVYEWPTGSCQGKLEWTGSRWHMKWFTNYKPLPWTIGNTALPEISIPGNPTLTVPASADAEHAAIEVGGTEPWLLGVKLFGEERRLHIRTYFRNPAAQFPDRGLSQLPLLVQQAIDNLPAGDGSGTLKLPPVAHVGTPPPPPRAARLVADIQEALKTDPNVLLVGPPGTGKSVALEDLRTLYESRNPAGTVLFDTSTWGGAWSVTGSQSRSEVLVFHPSYTYENFVAGLFPKSSATGGVDLEAQGGPILCLAHWVGDKDRRALLIIDEFNRGPAAAIFGDCLSLLDRDKRSTRTNPGAHIPRPYSSQPMPLPKSYADDPAVLEHIADEVRLPAGVHIVAAMNSTDRSVAPLDAAMRRRFSVIRVGPDYEVLAHRLKGNAASSAPFPTVITAWTIDDVSTLAISLLRALNERIEYCLGEDFLLGHALVWNLDAASVDARLKQLATAVDTKIVPTLRMTFIDQDEVLAAVLNIPDTLQVSSGQPIPGDRVAYWKAAPSSLASIAQRRLTVQKLSGLALSDQLQALLSLAAS
jgi:5-methylcytosine-specific restriction enzyme B